MTHRQTHTQTNRSKNITSLTEVIKRPKRQNILAACCVICIVYSLGLLGLITTTYWSPPPSFSGQQVMFLNCIYRQEIRSQTSRSQVTLNRSQVTLIRHQITFYLPPLHPHPPPLGVTGQQIPISRPGDVLRSCHARSSVNLF